MTKPPWHELPTLRRVILLEWLIDRGASPLAPASLADYVDESGFDEAMIYGDVDFLHNAGCVHAVRPQGGVRNSSAFVTAEGTDHVTNLQRQRRDTAAIRPACRRAVLYWLHDAGPTSPPIDTFASSSHDFYLGRPFSDAERDEAVLYLHGALLTGGLKRSDGIPSRPHLLAAGRECVQDHDGDVSEYKRSTRGHAVTINGNNNNVGDHNISVSNSSDTAITTVASTADLSPILDHIEQLLAAASLPAGDASEIATLLEQIRHEAASPTPNQRLIRSLLAGLRGIAVAAIGTAIGSDLSHLISLATSTTG